MPSSSQKPPSPTPFHTPSTHLLPQPPPPAGAPLKVDHTGFRDDSPSPRSVVGSVRGSAGQGAAGLGDALNRASTPVLDEGEPDGGGEWVTVKAPRKVHPYSPHRSSSLSLALTPDRTSLLLDGSEENRPRRRRENATAPEQQTHEHHLEESPGDTRGSARGGRLQRERVFAKRIEYSNAIAHAYTPPHRRTPDRPTRPTPSTGGSGTPPSPFTSPHYSLAALAHFDTSALPESEDDFYDALPGPTTIMPEQLVPLEIGNTLSPTSSSPLSSLSASFVGSPGPVFPLPPQRTALIASPLTTHILTRAIRQAGEARSHILACSLPSTAPQESHFSDEDEEGEAGSASGSGSGSGSEGLLGRRASWRRRRWSGAGTYYSGGEESEGDDGGEQHVVLEVHIHAGADDRGHADGNGRSERQGRRRRRSFVDGVPLDVPSPVWEESEEGIEADRIEREERAAADAEASEDVGKKEDGGEVEEEEEVCSSCGAPAVASFVALIPCTHLLCHTCLNALINSTAHKPPRLADCFFCGTKVESFAPALAVGELGLVEALRKTFGAGRKSEGLSGIEGDLAGRDRDGPTTATTATTTASARTKRDSLSKAQAELATAVEDAEAPHGHAFSPYALVSPARSRASSSGHYPYASYTASSPEMNLTRSSSASSLVGADSPLATRSAAPWARFGLSHTKASSEAHAQAGLLNALATATAAGTTAPYSAPTTPAVARSPPSRHPLAARRHSRTETPEDRRESSSGSGGGEMSPFRYLDWSAQASGTPPAKDGKGSAVEGAREVGEGPESSTSKSAVGSPAVRRFEPQDEISRPTEWPVVRLDNIPWDVTAAEVEDWLPSCSLPALDECILAVHILCNRADGRTLSQCFIEAASIAAARNIVRLRDGKKLAGRPVHVTLTSQGELMNTLFPSWEAGFTGVDARPGLVPGPLVMQSELSGLVALCKLDSTHASKVMERPYFNIATILQKFPFHQPERYNSRQVVRLFNTACAAAETLEMVREHVPDWTEIVTTFVEVAIACPVFRHAQKAKLIKKAGINHPLFPAATPSGSPDHPSAYSHSTTNPGSGPFSFSPPSLREAFVSVGLVSRTNHTTSAIDSPGGDHSAFARETERPRLGLRVGTGKAPMGVPNLLFVPPTPTLLATTPAPVALGSGSTGTGSVEKEKIGSKRPPRRRRLSSISRMLGVELDVVRSVAEQLGLGRDVVGDE